MVLCKYCIFWDHQPITIGKDKGVCKRISDDSEPNEAGVMAVAESDNPSYGAALYTSCDFGCVLGIRR